jgi:predicted Zn-dependent peptidase
MKHTFSTTKSSVGTRILFVSVPSSNSYCIDIICNAGFNLPKNNIHEIPHLLEHMAFESTKKYPKPNQFDFEIETIGAWSNATTDESIVKYSTVGSKNNYLKITELALEQYVQPLFTDDSLKRQKEIIELELNSRAQDEEDIIRLLTYERLFPTKVNKISERVKSLKKIRLRDVNSYHAITHTQSNTFVVIAGDISKADQAKISKLVETSLSKLPKAKKLDTKLGASSEQLGTIVAKKNNATNRIYFNLAFIKPTYENNIKYEAACVVADTIYNKGSGSRIFTKSRKAGLAYSVNSGIYNSPNCSELFIIEQSDSATATKLFKLCLSELVAIKAGEFTEQELVRAKGYAAGEYDTDYETSRDLASWYGNAFIDNDPIYSPQEFAKAIREVKKEDVIAVLKKFIKKDNWIISILGPNSKRHENDFNSIIKSLLI